MTETTKSSAEDERWIALSKARQQELLQKHHQCDTDYDWWDSIYESFVERLEEIGFTVSTTDTKQTCNGKPVTTPDVYFTGFYSQGDGAYFEGRVTDWTKFLAAMGKPEWAKWADESSWVASTTGGSGNNMSINVEVPGPDNPHDEDEDPLRYAAWNVANMPPTRADLDSFEGDVTKKFLALASELFGELRDEYEYRTDEEQIIAWILDNAKDELEEDDDE